MRRSPLAIIYLTVFIDLLGFGIILPVLPFYAASFGATGLLVGALLTAYSAAQFLAAPLLGRLSDRIGRRPVLLASLAGSAISLLVTGLATSLPLLIAGRAVAGLSGGSIAAAQAYIADITKPTERAKYMGMLGASIGMGFVFGPAIGAALSPYGFGTAALVAAGLAAINFVFALFRLPESRPRHLQAAPRGRLTLPLLSDALSHPTLGPLLWSTFLTTAAFVSMEATFALLGRDLFGLDAGSLGLIFTFVGIIIAIIQGGLIGRLSPRYGERRLAIVGMLLLGLTLLALPFTTNFLLSLLVLAIMAAGQGLTTPTISSLLSRATHADEQGATLGLGQSLAAAARAIGPLTAGWLFDLGPFWPYLVGSLLVLSAAGLIRTLTLEHP